MLNDAIRRFKEGEDLVFSDIIGLLNREIRSAIRTFKIPGQTYEDLYNIAVEEVLNCLQERKSKRGTGQKKTINYLDDETKNRVFIRTAIKYRMIRELNYTKAERRIGYDITYLNDNGERYLDRKGKPLYIGVIFQNGKGFLMEKMKNTQVVININKPEKPRDCGEYKSREILDNATSLNSTFEGDEQECEMRDMLEFKAASREYSKEESRTHLNIIRDIISNSNSKHKSLIISLLDNADSTYALKKIIGANRYNVKKIKPFLYNLLVTK